jgi:hypothetical protein
MSEEGKQSVARLAREAFENTGRRGVMIVHLAQEPPFKPRLEYNVMDTDEGTESAETVRELIERYDPNTQAVLYYHDAERTRAMAEIVDIKPVH